VEPPSTVVMTGRRRGLDCSGLLDVDFEHAVGVVRSGLAVAGTLGQSDRARELNWALHVIALQRIRHHPETSAYHERLLAAGKSTREARRCVRRALARHFYQRLREIPRLPLTT
jgi:hypothetical protein